MFTQFGSFIIVITFLQNVFIPSKELLFASHLKKKVFIKAFNYSKMHKTNSPAAITFTYYECRVCIPIEEINGF